MLLKILSHCIWVHYLLRIFLQCMFVCIPTRFLNFLRFEFKVLRRILGSMVPVRKRNYLTTQIRSNPDLYGELYLTYFYYCET